MRRQSKRLVLALIVLVVVIVITILLLLCFLFVFLFFLDIVDVLLVFAQQCHPIGNDLGIHAN